MRGNPAARTETLIDAEAGYRIELGTAASIDVTGYAGHYEHLRTQETPAPVVRLVPSRQILVTTRFSNQLAATTRGLEIAGHWTPIAAWRLDGSYTGFGDAAACGGSQDSAAGTEDGSAPRTQWQVQSAFWPGARATLAVAIFHVGSLEQSQVAAYTRADVSAEWQFTRRLSAMAIGSNLFDAAHAEFGDSGSLLRTTQMPRSVSVRLRWTSR